MAGAATPVHLCPTFLAAAKSDHPWCIDELLKQQQRGREEAAATETDIDTDTEEKDYGTGKSALMYAAELGHIDAMCVLIDGGAVVDATSINGHTPLMYAAANGHFHCVRALLERDANVHSKAHKGQTALMLVLIT